MQLEEFISLGAGEPLVHHAQYQQSLSEQIGFCA